MEPTEATISNAMAEYREVGEREFLRRYAEGHAAQVYFIVHEGLVYPMKALWAAATGRKTPEFSYKEAKARFPDFGHTVVRREEVEDELPLDDLEDDDLLEEAEVLEEENHMDFLANEGARMSVEATRLKRSAALVHRAKLLKGYVCEGCGFDFKQMYGIEYIEAHHIDPLSERDGIDTPTSVEDLVMLCANCHRVVHTRTPCMTLGELHRKIRKPKM